MCNHDNAWLVASRPGMGNHWNFSNTEFHTVVAFCMKKKTTTREMEKEEGRNKGSKYWLSLNIKGKTKMTGLEF